MMKPNSYRLSIKSTFILALLLILNSGCNDWIDIEPENELIKQEFWKTSDDVMAVLAGTYDALRETTQRSFLMGEIRADHILVGGGAFSNYSRIGANDISPTNGEVGWGSYYKTINLANTVMTFAPIIQELDQTLTDDILEGIEAEMLFVRSLSYFYLVRLWKDVPLVLEATVSDTVDFYIPKSPEKAVLKQIVSDLERANALAKTPNPYLERSTLKGRANKYAIQALLADVLLWSERYSECIAYCDSLISLESNPDKYDFYFDLEDNTDWFELYYPGNSFRESIFEIQYDDDLEQQENPIYENSLLDNLSADLDKMPYDEDADVRFCNGKGPVWKYVGTDETGAGFRRRTTSEKDGNFIYYRYADVLLIKAEALAEQNNFTEANLLVERVAGRAGVPYTYVSNLEGFRTKILTERGLEFASEGKRWFDVLRMAKKDGFKDTKVLKDILLGKASDAKELAIMRTKVIDTMSYYLPISQNEIQYNRNLVQNPFYDR